MHSKDARAEGETEQRLYTLSAWRETPFFSERVEAARCFDDKELADLMLAIIAINGWNRLAITFQGTVGGYRSPTPAASSGDSRRT
jgi:alkylhydroperoxidase family enzyme